MNPISKQVVIIGGGPAGLAAAVELKRRGIQDVLVLEREHEAGGILRQCIHDGFGLTRFGESLSGPEYAARFLEQALALGVEIRTGTTVVHLSQDKLVNAVSPDGLRQYQAQAVLLAMGCRERTRGALAIPGTRPSGVYTAGVAQNYVNLKNTMPGRRVIILGSGDIGMIMARRMTLEGAEVLGVFELQPYPSGLPRNIQQCLRDYDIPLHLSHTVTAIHGDSRLTGVTISRVDPATLRPIPGTEQDYACDTLILSVGLIPENELSLEASVALDGHTKGAAVDTWRQTSVPGIFAAGNVLHVHDLVDFVSLEAEQTAGAITAYLAGRLPACDIPVEPGEGLVYALPQRINAQQPTELCFRVRRPMRPCRVQAIQNGQVIAEKKFIRAIPAEMERLPLLPGALLGDQTVKVVASDDE